jgi:hypothetical protein
MPAPTAAAGLPWRACCAVGRQHRRTELSIGEQLCELRTRSPAQFRAVVNGFVNETRRNGRDGVERGVIAKMSDFLVTCRFETQEA